MEEQASHDPKPRRFLWGMLLAWGSFLLLMLWWIPEVFHGISENKATGLGAVAGGLNAWLRMVWFGACQVGAIILLARSFARGHPWRTIFSVLSIGWSALLAALFALSVWAVYWRAG